MIIFLSLAVIVGASVVLIEEALRKAPEAVEDEHGFHIIGEGGLPASTRTKAPTLPSMLPS
jgi:hypothetical protein